MKRFLSLGLIGAALLAGCGSSTTPPSSTDGTGAMPTSAAETGAAPTVATDLEPTTAAGTDAVTQPTLAPGADTSTEPTTAPDTEAAPTTAAGTDAAAQPTAAPAGTTATEDLAVTQQVTIPELGVSFMVPEGWVADAETNTWSASGSGLPLVGFNSADVTPDWKPSSFFQENADIKSTQTVTLPSGSINLYMVENTDGTAESHAVMQNGEKAYDFYARAASMPELQSFQPVLTNILTTVQLNNT